MDSKEIIKRVIDNHSKIEVSNSQLDIITMYVNSYFRDNSAPSIKGLQKFLIQNASNLELGNSQVDILIDIVGE